MYVSIAFQSCPIVTSVYIIYAVKESQEGVII